MLPLQNWSFSFLLRSHIKAQIAAKGLNPNLKGFKLKNLQTQISLHSLQLLSELKFTIFIGGLTLKCLLTAKMAQFILPLWPKY